MAAITNEPRPVCRTVKSATVTSAERSEGGGTSANRAHSVGIVAASRFTHRTKASHGTTSMAPSSRAVTPGGVRADADEVRASGGGALILGGTLAFIIISAEIRQLCATRRRFTSDFVA